MKAELNTSTRNGLSGKIGGVNNSTHNTHIEITDFFNRSTNVLERLHKNFDSNHYAPRAAS